MMPEPKNLKRNFFAAIKISIILLGIAFCILALVLSFKATIANTYVNAEEDLSNTRFCILSESVQSDDMDGSFHYYIAYEKITKVMYVIGKAEGSSPTFTVMETANGTPLLFKGKDE